MLSQMLEQCYKVLALNPKILDPRCPGVDALKRTPIQNLQTGGPSDLLKRFSERQC